MKPPFPRHYLASGRNIGIKPEALDFGVLFSKNPCNAAGVFTRNNFPGNPVIVGRERIKDGRLQCIIVNSGIANVATGEAGLRDVYDYCDTAARNLEINADLILPSSTGVIGRPLSLEKLNLACQEISTNLKEDGFYSFAQAIMTTDTIPKILARELKSGIRITGIAKGAGMIQPNMATMLAYIVTDADIPAADLKRLISCITERTFNRVSVDGDTSTSDTYIILANGASGVKVQFHDNSALKYNELNDPFNGINSDVFPELDEKSIEFVRSVSDITRNLARLIAGDGEGAEKLIELIITEARDRVQAEKIGRSIINSPLFKAAIHGAYPSRGRFLMAIGKVFDEPLPLDEIKISIGDIPLSGSNDDLDALSSYLKNDEININVSLGAGSASETLWGCDLTEEYVKINAYHKN